MTKKKKNLEAAFVGPSHWPARKQRKPALRSVFVLGIFVSVAAAFGMFAAWQAPNSSPAPAPTELIDSPTYDAASPAVEYVYAGGKLIAAIEAARPVPADLAIWRASTGSWWVLNGENSSHTTQGWGINGDIPVPGDYDGDGKTDFSVFRPSTSQWYILKSSDLSSSVWAWGTSTDIVAPSDYDGDGKTDRAVWRPSNGTWYVVRSSDQSMMIQNYGLTGDLPAPADYDGDSRADIGVWRSQNSHFYSINSSDGGSQTIAFNSAGTQPVCADYDGDGRSDYATKNGNTWRIRKSATGQIETIVWQAADDMPVQNDYDGDGKVDVAVWRNSNGNWYIRQSSRTGQANELRQVAWGMSGDVPVPAYYRR